VIEKARLGLIAVSRDFTLVTVMKRLLPWLNAEFVLLRQCIRFRRRRSTFAKRA
jgi:hypothetical protein